MIQYQDFEFKHYTVIGLIILLLLTRIFANKPLVAKNKDYISIFIFIVIGIIVGIEFWHKKIYIGIIALVLASAVLGKVYWDKLRGK